MLPVKTVEKEFMELYVMKLPCDGFPEVEQREAYVIPVMEREGGILLALPVTFLPQEWVQLGQSGDAEAIFGPSIETKVQAMEEDEAGLQPVGAASFAALRPCHRRRRDPMFLGRLSSHPTFLKLAVVDGLLVDGKRRSSSQSPILLSRGGAGQAIFCGCQAEEESRSTYQTQEAYYGPTWRSSSSSFQRLSL